MIKPPSEILKALKEGRVGTWNKWKREQVGVVDLQGADLLCANLTGANLLKADLTKANLQDANLEGADLQETNLLCANLREANLQGANLDGADLEETNLEGTGIAYRWLRYRCIITPCYAWIGCKEGSHEYWENLAEEEALALDEDAPLLWDHREELLGLMRECREKGWPKGDDR